MGKRLMTRPARDHADVVAFFDASASGYAEQHGEAERLLRYRLHLLSAPARLRADDTVLEIGCGSGLHLVALADRFVRGIGTDLSPAMITAARDALDQTPWKDKIEFRVDAGEHLRSIGDSSIDVVVCTGALEHMLDKGAVLRSVYRVLKSGGRLVLLTLNGGSVWYRYLAPMLGYDTRHLATDHYVTRAELRELAGAAGFGRLEIDTWTFVQRGDMPGPIARMLDGLDWVGRACNLRILRGGLRLYAVKG
jgi:2-polyprenyl-6-hydroxyphenyl methylase/3-demethylubiquinone-9 3-methyltransferase